jgi:D-glycero-alpha-D-manno-heptose-7-phosphate kinase
VPHRSSEVHEQVITFLQGVPDPDTKLGPLREAAAAAAAALRAADLSAYGAALVANTRAQALLHPALVNDDARRLIDLARSHRALGWKVNGAGGDGGSMTVLGPADDDARAALRAQIDQVPRWKRLPFHVAKTGARVRVQAAS